MFVLTQLPTFPPITKFFARKAIRACAPKVLSEPDLSWSGSGSGPGLVLVAAWLPRVTEGEAQYYPVTSGRPLDWLSLFFYYNEKVCLQKKRLSWT